MTSRLASSLFALALAACASAPTGPTGTVEVSFRDPENFADLRVSRLQATRERESLLASLRMFIETEARTLVPAGSKLAIAVTQVDMAGDFGSGGGQTMDTRVVHDSSPPRIDLEFALTGSDGAVVKQGRRELRDPQFQLRPTLSSDVLRFEKVMLSDWLDREFAPPKK